MQSQQPLVSVIIPAYNHARFVEQAVRSVWTQEYSNVELIAIDDGSHDETYRVLADLSNASPIPMRVFTKENEGICTTLNKGVELAGGDYLSFLASDDYYPPDRIKRHMEILRELSDEKIGGCCGKLRGITENGSLKKSVKKYTAVALDDNQFVSVVLQKHPFSLEGGTFKAHVCRELLFDPDLSAEDWDFYIRLTMKYKIVPVDAVSCYYRDNSSGAHRNVPMMIDSRTKIMNKYKNHPAFSEDISTAFVSRIFLANSQIEYKFGSYWAAFGWLAESIRAKPITCCHEWHYIGSLIKRAALALFKITRDRVTLQSCLKGKS